MNRPRMLALTLLAVAVSALLATSPAADRQYDDPEKQRAYERHKDRYVLTALSQAEGDDPNFCVSVVVEAKNYSGNRCPGGQHRWRVGVFNFCAQPVHFKFDVLPALPSTHGDELGGGWYSLQSINDPVIARLRDNNELTVIHGTHHHSACVPRKFVDSVRVRWCANWSSYPDAQGEIANGVAHCEFREGDPRVIVTDRGSSRRK